MADDNEPKIFQDIRDILGGESASVEPISDFDKAIFEAFQEVSKHFGHVTSLAFVVAFNHNSESKYRTGVFLAGDKYELFGTTAYLHKSAEQEMYRG